MEESEPLSLEADEGRDADSDGYSKEKDDTPVTDEVVVGDDP